MAKIRGAETAQEVSDEIVGAAIEGNAAAPQVAAQVVAPRKYTVDRGGGQIHVQLASNEKDHFVQLRVNKKTVDSQESINGKVTLRFQNGWPAGDFSYEII